MTTGTIIMIVCAVLYGLIVIIFKDINLTQDYCTHDDNDHLEPTALVTGIPGSDGASGISGTFSEDLEINHQNDI